MEMYEVQVLDSYNNRTYADGQCARFMVGTCRSSTHARKPGEWQTYDIIFHRPTFKNGKVDRKVRFTVIP